MLITDLLDFKKKFKDKPPCITLVLAKEGASARLVALELIDLWRSSKTRLFSFESEHFTPPKFVQEVETHPFLADKVLGTLFDVDSISLSALEQYLKRPSPWVSLVLTASSLSKSEPIYKLAAKQGVVLHLDEEKPWEKERKAISWLVARGAEKGALLEGEVAAVMVKNLSTNRGMLAQELDKLICYTAQKGRIEVKDVATLCCKMPQETLWQLGEALFTKDAAKAIGTLKALLEEEVPLFTILAHLRTQIKNALLTLSLYQKEGKEAVLKTFPYLKGALLEKKLMLYQRCGQKRLQKGFLALFDAELKAKTSSVAPRLLLEMALIKLTL